MNVRWIYLAFVAYILYSFVESEADGEGPCASQHATTELPATSHHALHTDCACACACNLSPIDNST